MLLSSQFTSNYFSISQVEQNFDDFAADFAGARSWGPLEPIVRSLLPALRVRSGGPVGTGCSVSWLCARQVEVMRSGDGCLRVPPLLRRRAGPLVLVC